MFTDVAGRTCLVVGGGRVAEERARRLLEHGASIRLVAPVISPTIEDMLTQAEASEIRQREYGSQDLDGCLLAVAAADVREVNRAVHRDARARGIPCNVADDPSLCDFIVPAVVRRGDLALAVSTGGASPVVSAHVRGMLEDVFGPEWGELIALLGELRDESKRRHPEPAARSSRVRAVLESDVLSLLRSGDSAGARRRVRELLDLEGG